MDPYKAWLRDVLQLAGEIYFRRVEAELWKFAEALDHWLHKLFERPRPDWRESFGQLLAQQEAEGRVVEPKSRQDLLDYLESCLGQAGREQLLVFFREVAALGCMSRTIQDPEKSAVEPLLTQQRKVQEAYDRSISAKIGICREWTRYLSMEWFIGPEALKLFQKIDNALPDRVEGFKSSLDGKLKQTWQAAHEATVKKRQHTDAAYTALVWTDNVIAVIEIATLIGSAKAVFRQTVKKMVAKGLSRAAARSVAVAYTVAHLGTAAASAVVIGGVVPKVLVDAGLDEADVRAGLAVFRALFTLVGLRSVGKQRVLKKTTPRDRVGSSRSTPKRMSKKKVLSRRKARLEVGEAFNRAQASKYPYNEIRIIDPDGGRPYILDSYNPFKGEIVFRRDTQFSEIKLSTANAYLREFTKKYPPGRTIADVPSSGDLAGEVLRGRMIFEVPPQWKKIPAAVLKQAGKLRITIRDSNGKVCE
jgi:hypothetical protein